jgi:curved DNA-binding protein CbpA
LNLSGASKINLIKVLALPLQELNKYNRKKKSKARTAIYTRRSALRILGLDSKASQSDIRKKYLRMRKRIHPNKNPDDPDASAKFVEMSEAYEFLKKQPVSRRKHSATRNNSRREIKNRSRSRDYNESR